MQLCVALALARVWSRLWLQTEGLGGVGLGRLLRAGRRLLDGRLRLVAALVAPAEVGSELVIVQIADGAEGIFLAVHFGKRFNQCGYIVIPNHIRLVFGGLLLLALFILLSVFVGNVKDLSDTFRNALIIVIISASNNFGLEGFGSFSDRLLKLFLFSFRLNALLKQINRGKEILIVWQFLASKFTKRLLQKVT